MQSNGLGMIRLSSRAIGRIVLATTVALGLMALLLPSEVPRATPAHSYVGWLELLALHITDVGNIASRSLHPSATAITYASALILGVAVALLAAVSQMGSRLRERVRTGLPAVRPVFMFAMLMTAVAAPFVFSLNVNQIQFSAAFFRWVSTSRIGLLLWAEMVFVFVFVAALWCLVQLFVWTTKRE